MNIKAWMKEKNLTEFEISQATGISYYTIQRWRLQNKQPSPMAAKLLKAKYGEIE